MTQVVRRWRSSRDGQTRCRRARFVRARHDAPLQRRLDASARRGSPPAVLGNPLVFGAAVTGAALGDAVLADTALIDTALIDTAAGCAAVPAALAPGQEEARPRCDLLGRGDDDRLPLRRRGAGGPGRGDGSAG